MLNSLQLKQYQNTTLTNILSSQFVYSSINEKCEIKKQELIIENKKNKKIYYLYLFLTTNKRPYVKQQYIVSKNMKKTAAKPKIKSITWKVEVKKLFFFRTFSQMLFQMIAFQTNSEKKILNLNGKNLNLIIQYAPLTTRTAGLKSKNSYLSDIRLFWKLKWTKKTSIFQKIFLLKHLQVLNEDISFRGLEDATV